MSEKSKIIEDLAVKLAELETILDLPAKRLIIDKNKALQGKPDFWTDQEKAVEIGQETERLVAQVAPFDKMDKDLNDTADLLVMAESEKETELLLELR